MCIISLLSTSALGFDLEAHRGGRGLMPENTLQAFAKALRIGVTTLEMDAAMSRDGVVVISHDPRLNPALTRGPDGRWLRGATPLIRDLSAAELGRYDVGRMDPRARYGRKFPQQSAVDGAHIPRLVDVFDLVTNSGNTQVRFNIEIKINPNKPEETWSGKKLVEAVMEVIREAGMTERVILQSFDWHTLQYIQQRAAEIPTSYLSAEQQWLDNMERDKAGSSAWTAGLDFIDFNTSLPSMIAKAGGAIWSPYYREVDAAKVAEAHKLGLKVIVWTVNDNESASQLMDMGVDGIISDYPDKIRQLMKERGLDLPQVTRFSVPDRGSVNPSWQPLAKRLYADLEITQQIVQLNFLSVGCGTV